MKKFYYLLLMVMCSLQCLAQDFEYEYEGKTLKYTVVSERDRTCKVQNGDKYMSSFYVDGDVSIPSIAYLKGQVAYTVISIGERAFCGLREVTSISLPNTILSIEEDAFNYCEKLSSMTIPSSVTSIGDCAFYGCHSLTSIQVPQSTSHIGGGAFSYCRNLQVIDVPSDNPFYCSMNGILFDKNKTLLIQCPGAKEGKVSIPNSVEIIGYRAFSLCTKLQSIEIPNSVTTIEAYGFQSCESLSSLTLPTSVITIGEYAFYGCNALTTINLPNSVTKLGSNTFSYSGLSEVFISASVEEIGEAALNCPKLKTINVSPDNKYYCSENGILYDKDKRYLIKCPALVENGILIPNTVERLEDYAFERCTNLQSLVLPNSLQSIGNYAFSLCDNLISVEIPNSVNILGDYTFSHCINLASIDFPDSIVQIGKGTFINCIRLKSAKLPSSIDVIEDEFFFGCYSLKDISIPSSVQRIGYDAFYYCKTLKTLTLPESVTTIIEGAFGYCQSVEELYLPSSLSYIGYSAFSGYDKLAKIYYNSDNPVSGSSWIFSNFTYANTVLYVPQGSIDIYKTTEPWNNFFHIEEFDFAIVESIESEFDDNLPYRIYNLSGVYVGNTLKILPKGTYIMRQGSKCKKIIK